MRGDACGDGTTGRAWLFFAQNANADAQRKKRVHRFLIYDSHLGVATLFVAPFLSNRKESITALLNVNIKSGLDLADALNATQPGPVQADGRWDLVSF